MINTLEELLQDYARYSFIEGTIDENTSVHLVEDAQNYIKTLGKENLLNIPVVIGTLFCDCETPNYRWIGDDDDMYEECFNCRKDKAK
jgi:hypothetical protein